MLRNHIFVHKAENIITMVMISVCICVWKWQNADKTLINTIDWGLGTHSMNMCTNTIKVQSTNTIEHSTPRKMFPLLHFHPKNISSSKK